MKSYVALATALELLKDPEILQKAQELRQTNPREYEEKIDDQIKASIEYASKFGEPVMAQLSGTQIIESEKVIENKPIVKILDTKNVYIDPTCNGNFDDALFVILSFETNQAECKKAKDAQKELIDRAWTKIEDYLISILDMGFQGYVEIPNLYLYWPNQNKGYIQS